MRSTFSCLILGLGFLVFNTCGQANYDDEDLSGIYEILCHRYSWYSYSTACVCKEGFIKIWQNYTGNNDVYICVIDTDISSGSIASGIPTTSVEDTTPSNYNDEASNNKKYMLQCPRVVPEFRCVCKEGFNKIWQQRNSLFDFYACESDTSGNIASSIATTSVEETNTFNTHFSTGDTSRTTTITASIERNVSYIPDGCKSDTMRENADMCSNTTKQNHSNNGNNSSFCSVLESTFKRLQDVCKGNSSATSLQDTAKDFKNLVSLSNVETKKIVSVVTLGLESLHLIALRRAYSSSNNSDQIVVSNSIVIQTQVINKEHILQNRSVRFDAQGDQMDIHSGAVTNAATEDSVAVAFISVSGLESLLGGNLLQNGTVQSGRILESIHVNSRVVSASTSSGTKKLSSPINLTFSHLENKDPHETVICVHLNSAVGNDAWSPEGCHELHSNTTHSKCSCQYLSSFAVLMATVPKHGGLVLFLISNIGLIISLICLFLCIVTFIFCRSAQNSSTFIHLQLSLCLFFADLFFIIGIDKTYNKVICSVVAGMLQYLFLACFVWMFLEGVNLYLIVKNLKTANYGGASKYMKRSMYACGYGLPAVIVGISAAIVPGAYGTHYHCWLNSDKGFIWSFMGPVCAIIVVNTVFFCLVLKILREKLASVNSKVSTLKSTRSLTFKAIAHLFILGLTWFLGLFQFGPLREVMEYLFTLTNSVQGVFIFLVHCLLNKKVREAYWNLICCRKDTKHPDSEMTMTSVPSSIPVVNMQKPSGEQEKIAWKGDSSSDIPPH